MNHRLESWLASATLDLALSERQRIHDEVSAHVGDAIAHQTAQGLSEPDAEARAIQDLGDPRIARAAFSRTCYTLTDEIRLEQLLRRSWWSFPLAVLCVCIFVAVTVLTLSDAPIVLNEGITRSSPWFIPLMLSPLFFAPAYYFEPSIKRWLFKRSLKYGIISVQAFMALLALIWIPSAVQSFFMLVQSLISGRANSLVDTWIVVFILTYRWIAHQAPLTLKTIRRSQA